MVGKQFTTTNSIFSKYVIINYLYIFLNYSLYTFDIRKLDIALNVHMDHVSAVMDVDYSPTGKEFVSGSFDKSVRIFPSDKGRSR